MITFVRNLREGSNKKVFIKGECCLTCDKCRYEIDNEVPVKNLCLYHKGPEEFKCEVRCPKYFIDTRLEMLFTPGK